MTNESPHGSGAEAPVAPAAERVVGIMTFKAGRFPLSRAYCPEKIRDDKVRFESLYGVLSTLPILPNLANRLERELIRRSIFGTAAIEGNPLSEREVGEILDQPATAAAQRADREIANLSRAYERFAKRPVDATRTPLHVTEDLIRNINAEITRDIPIEDHAPGVYRNVPVEVGNADHGGVYRPPKALADIKKLMAAFAEWINSEAVVAEGPLVRAFLAHYHLARIHPFRDGNGRTARLLEAAMLTQSGYRFIPQTLSNFYYKNLDEYFVAISAAEKTKEDDVTPFLAFCFRMLVLSVEEVQQSIHWRIRMLALRDFYEFSRKNHDITKRQYDLLCILLEKAAKITLRDLSSDPVFRPLYARVSKKTARRDLERLAQRRFLLRKGDAYMVNPFTLDS